MPTYSWLAAEAVTENEVASINLLLPQLNPALRPVTFESLRQVLERTHLVVARDDRGTIIGMVYLAPLVLVSAVCGRVEDMVVDERFRQQGIGRALMQELIKKARELGFERLDLCTHPSRAAANALYQSLGFVFRETNVYKMDLRA